MKVTEIIAEYNPFHNGHLYHIQTAKAMTGADYVIVVMSGNFTQRGIPALISKYTRARHALLAGADLVLQIPMPYAISSAEYFAAGSCALLDSLGVVDTLCFGAEQDNIAALQELSAIISAEPVLYQNLLKQNLSAGLSFPRAQQEALKVYDPGMDVSLLSSPNNRLGLEYLKALARLNSPITPFPIKRKGKDYDDLELSAKGEDIFSSASAIRRCIADSSDPTAASSVSAVNDSAKLSTHMPDFVWTDLTELLKGKEFILTSDLDLLLHYKLLQQSSESLQSYLDINADMANKILHNLPAYNGFDAFCSLLKSKDITYTRISRLLLHILLDLKKSDIELLKDLSNAPYGRILGFKKDSSPLLRNIKEHASLPIITKLADAPSMLSSEAQTILDKEIAASHIYEAILSHKSGKAFKNEDTQQIQSL